MSSQFFRHIAIWAFGLTIPVLPTALLPAASASPGNELARFADCATQESNVHERPGPKVTATFQTQLATLANVGQIGLKSEVRKKFRRSRASNAALIGQRAVEEIVNQLNKQIALSFDINVLFIECGEAEAFYDKHTNEIVICYQLLERNYYLFSRNMTGKTERSEATKAATVSLFLHELAHALIDVWKLPITGREEDAADQFATLLMINGMHDGERIALNGARIFKLYADQNKSQRKFYWDSHSFDEQRFYDTICLIYGHDPEKYNYLIENGTLPVQRALDCEDDYARVKQSWQTLLAPFSKRQSFIFVNDAGSPLPKRVL